MTLAFTPGAGRGVSENFAAKFARTNARGEFALRITSMEDFTLVDATRMVPLEDGRQELQRLVPLRPSTLRSDGENRLVMKKDRSELEALVRRWSAGFSLHTAVA